MMADDIVDAGLFLTAKDGRLSHTVDERYTVAGGSPHIANLPQATSSAAVIRADRSTIVTGLQQTRPRSP